MPFTVLDHGLFKPPPHTPRAVITLSVQQNGTTSHGVLMSSKTDQCLNTRTGIWKSYKSPCNSDACRALLLTLATWKRTWTANNLASLDRTHKVLCLTVSVDIGIARRTCDTLLRSTSYRALP